jgi:phosphoribosylformylglycinamidine cyclo-ligase
MAQRPYSYKQAGVDLEAAEALVGRIAPLLRRTYGPRVLDRHGLFAGLFCLDYEERLFRRSYRQPVLVGCTDGVGSKVLVAAGMGRLDTVGIDLVAMSVNDLVTTGAEPLFFLDYLAVHKLDPEQVAKLVEGIAIGCERADCALLGGETAEMPDLYRRGEFDMAGFAVGVVDQPRLIDSRRVAPGDVLIGLGSDGLHANGYALARRVFLKRARIALRDHVDQFGHSLGDELLTPTRIYVRPVLKVLAGYRRKKVVSAMAHITGGGLPGNLARVLGDKCDAVVRLRSWEPPRVFGMLRRLGAKSAEMYSVFNMGIGFVLVVRPTFANAIMRRLRRLGESVYRIGYVKRGSGTVELRP